MINRYVLDLFHNPEKSDDKKNELKKNIKAFNKLFNNSIAKHEENFEGEKSKKSFFRKNIYDWNENFRFTSRFVNTHVVAYLALFHFSMFILYYLIYLVLLIQQNISLINFNALANITVGDVLCALGSDFCIIDLNWPLPIPSVFTQFNSSFIPSSNSLFVVPFF